MKNLEIREEAKDIKGTLAWWDSLPKKTFVEKNKYGVPTLYLELEEEIKFLAEIAYEDDSCRRINGCNVAFVVGDERFDIVLFSFPLTKKCREAIDEFIETEVDKFVEWWEQA